MSDDETTPQPEREDGIPFERVEHALAAVVARRAEIEDELIRLEAAENILNELLGHDLLRFSRDAAAVSTPRRRTVKTGALRAEMLRFLDRVGDAEFTPKDAAAASLELYGGDARTAYERIHATLFKLIQKGLIERVRVGVYRKRAA